MNKAVKMVLVLVIILMSVSCVPTDFPTSYNKSKWVAQEVDFNFEVDDSFYDETSFNTKGCLKTKDKVEIITLEINPGGLMSVRNMPKIEIVENEVSGKEELQYTYNDDVFQAYIFDWNEYGFKLRIDEEYQYIFGDEPIKEITFVREEMPKDEESESLDISKGE